MPPSCCQCVISSFARHLIQSPGAIQALAEPYFDALPFSIPKFLSIVLPPKDPCLHHALRFPRTCLRIARTPVYSLTILKSLFGGRRWVICRWSLAYESLFRRAARSGVDRKPGANFTPRPAAHKFGAECLRLRHTSSFAMGFTLTVETVHAVYLLKKHVIECHHSAEDPKYMPHRP